MELRPDGLYVHGQDLIELMRFCAKIGKAVSYEHGRGIELMADQLEIKLNQVEIQERRLVP